MNLSNKKIMFEKIHRKIAKRIKSGKIVTILPD